MWYLLPIIPCTHKLKAGIAYWKRELIWHKIVRILCYQKHPQTYVGGYLYNENTTIIATIFRSVLCNYIINKFWQISVLSNNGMHTTYKHLKPQPNFFRGQQAMVKVNVRVVSDIYKCKKIKLHLSQFIYFQLQIIKIQDLSTSNY
jgi:hypothetical protein